MLPIAGQTAGPIGIKLSIGLKFLEDTTWVGGGVIG